MKPETEDEFEVWTNGFFRAVVYLKIFVLAAIVMFFAWPSETGAAQLYIPVASQHFGDENRKTPLNENNYGLGFENDKGYFAVGLRDSLNNPMWAAGRAWRWRTNSEPYVGVGVSAMVIARSNVKHYMPFPAVLPILTVGYGRMALDLTVIPKTEATKYGAVFGMLRWEF